MPTISMVNVAALDCLQHIMMTDGYQDGMQQYDLCCHSNHIHSHVALTTWVSSVDANGRSIPQNCLASDQGLAAADDSNAHDDSQQLLRLDSRQSLSCTLEPSSSQLINGPWLYGGLFRK